MRRERSFMMRDSFLALSDFPHGIDLIIRQD